MAGKIRTNEKCPMCGGQFGIELTGMELDLLCLQCQTRPNRVYIDGRDLGIGKLYSDQKGRVFDSFRHAFRVLETVRREVDLKEFDKTKYRKQDQRKYLIENFYEEWFESLKPDLKPATSYMKNYICRRFILPYFQGQDIREIRKYHVTRFLLTVPGKTNKIKARCELQAMLNYAYENELLSRSIRIPKIKAKKSKRFWLTYDQQMEILALIPEWDRPICQFIIAYGCRPGEARALQWDCISFEKGQITLQRTFSKKVLVDSIKQGDPNIIPMTEEIRDLLVDLRGKRKDLSKPWVFLNINHRNYGEGLSKKWAKAAGKAGFPPQAELYCNRHSFVMQRLNTFTYAEIGAVLGHSTVRTTEIYGRLNAKGLVRVVAFRNKIRKVGRE